MLKMPKVKHITNRLYRELKKHDKHIIRGFDPEAIHRFRVGYKKLRAFLKLLSMQKGVAGKIKIFKNLKRGYRLSGRIRDLQLQYQRITETAERENKIPEAYINFLQKETGKLKKQCRDVFIKNPVAKCKKRTDASVPDEFKKNGFRDFVRQNWEAVRVIASSRHLSDDDIHAIRKSLKDILYNLEIYEGDEQDRSPGIWKGGDREYLNKLTDELGRFHDRCISIALLRSYLFRYRHACNNEPLEHIKKEWIKDRENMKRQLALQITNNLLPYRSIRNIGYPPAHFLDIYDNNH